MIHWFAIDKSSIDEKRSAVYRSNEAPKRKHAARHNEKRIITFLSSTHIGRHPTFADVITHLWFFV
jgi:hypothetical protein